MSNAPSNSSKGPRDRLRIAARDYRSLVDAQGELHLPMAARALVVAMTACGQSESAARCSAFAESLHGLGDKNEYSHDYVPTVQRLRAELGEERFERLRSEGQRLAPSDVLEIAAALLGEAQ